MYSICEDSRDDGEKVQLRAVMFQIHPYCYRLPAGIKKSLLLANEIFFQKSNFFFKIKH